MARTTLDLDRSVLDQLRRRAAREKKSMGQVASEALVQALAEPAASARPAPVDWVSRNLGPPKVDLDDKEAVRRIMDADS